MRYRIKQNREHWFQIQCNLEALDVVMGHERWFSVDRNGDSFEPFRDKRWWENSGYYSIQLREHYSKMANFHSLKEAREFLKEINTRYPIYYDA